MNKKRRENKGEKERKNKDEKKVGIKKGKMDKKRSQNEYKKKVKVWIK